MPRLRNRSNPGAVVCAAVLGLLSGAHGIALAQTPPTNNAPEFPTASTTREVAENSDPDVDVGDPVTATDNDNDPLTYSLEGTDADSFTIVSTSGQIRTKAGATYDYETKSTYAVQVIADDGNGGTAGIDVTIELTDIDERPHVEAILRVNVFDIDRSLKEIFPADQFMVTERQFGLFVRFSADVAGLDAHDVIVGNGVVTQVLRTIVCGSPQVFCLIVQATGDDQAELTVDIPADVVDGGNLPTLPPVAGVTPGEASDGVATRWVGTIQRDPPITAQITTDADLPVTGGLTVVYTFNQEVLYRAAGESTSIDPEEYFNEGDVEVTWGTNTIALGVPPPVTTGDHSVFHTEESTLQTLGVPPADYEGTLTVRLPPLTVWTTNGAVNPDESVLKVPVDTRAPALVGATANGTELVLTWHEPLDAGSVPGTSEFTVEVGGSAVTVDAVEVDGALVTLTLASAVTSSDTVTVSYAKPSSGPLRDEAGNEAGALSGESVTVTATAPNTAPTFDEEDGATREAPENSPEGTNLGGPITAGDDDGGTLTWSLEGTDADSFDIDSTTGQIRTKAGVTYDHEAKSIYSVTVRVADGSGGSETIKLVLCITDVDEPPDAPAAPAVAATPDATTEIDVSWTAPDNAGRPDITDYDLQYRIAGGEWTAWDHFGRRKRRRRFRAWRRPPTTRCRCGQPTTRGRVAGRRREAGRPMPRSTPRQPSLAGPPRAVSPRTPAPA